MKDSGDPIICLIIQVSVIKIANYVQEGGNMEMIYVVLDILVHYVRSVIFRILWEMENIIKINII